MTAGKIKPQGEERKPFNFWTKEETDFLEKGLKLHGKNVVKLHEHLPNRSHKEIKNKYSRHNKTLEKQKKSNNSELMEILEKVHEKYWTEAENLLFEEAVKKHGVDKDQI